MRRPRVPTAGVRRELGAFRHPKIAEKIGFATGMLIVAVGWRTRRRIEDRARLRRIEEKLDENA